MWPDYMSKETLAKRLDLAVGAIDQYVKRGLLPPPVKIGESLRFCWNHVDSFLKSGKTSGDSDDPYLSRLADASEAAPSRRHGPKQDRAAILLSDPAQGNGEGR